ncbi:MAG TPA: response regulator transcription factor [Bryobacteraceae bacterium]
MNLANDASRIRVLCVDDHPLVLEGIRAVLGAHPDIEVVATAENGEQALAMFRQHQPDVTIMDLKMPVMSGLQAVKEMRDISPEARIIILTTYEGDEDVYQALHAGAATYLLKDMLADNLVRSLRIVHEGGRPISEEVAARLADRIGQPALTRREVEVLGLIAKGCRNKEVGGQLGISEETVQVHVKNIMTKMKVHDRTEAVTAALRRGILHLG